MEDAEAIAARRIRETWPDLERWGDRGMTPFMPHEGSALWLDDLDCPAWPLSQLAVSGLSVARDHLHAMRVHIESLQLFAFASGSLLRGGLLGAAQAVWMLAPEDKTERVLRSRVVALELVERQAQYLRDLCRLPEAGSDPNLQVVLGELGALRTEIQDMRATDGQRQQWDATATIEAAVTSTFGKALAIEGRIEWRRLSGAAHGMVRPALNRPENTPSAPDENGRISLVMPGALADNLNAYLLIYGLTRRGWQLLDQRASDVNVPSGA